MSSLVCDPPIIKSGGRLWAFDIGAPMKAAYLSEPEAGGRWQREWRHTEQRWSHRKLWAPLRLRSMQKHPLAPSHRSAAAYWDGVCGRLAMQPQVYSFIKRIQLVKRELVQKGFVEKRWNLGGAKRNYLQIILLDSTFTAFIEDISWGLSEANGMLFACVVALEVTQSALPLQPVQTWNIVCKFFYSFLTFFVNHLNTIGRNITLTFFLNALDSYLVVVAINCFAFLLP